MNNLIKYAVLILIGFLIGCAINCKGDSKEDNRVQKKIDSLRLIIRSLEQIKSSDLDTLESDASEISSKSYKIIKKYYEKKRPIIRDTTYDAMWRKVFMSEPTSN